MASGPNIREVAKAAGVSVATVSGVLNNSGRHSPATAATVRQVMQEMGYVPRRNKLRRLARTGDVLSVGVLFPDVHPAGTQTPLGKGLAKGVQKALSEQNAQVSVLTLDDDGNLPEAITSGALAGVVVRSGSHAEGGDERLGRDLARVGIPVVWTFGTSSMPSVDAVMVDDRGCGIWAADWVPADCRDVLIVGPKARNIDIEFRMVAFEYHLRERRVTSQRLAHESDAALKKAFQELPESPLTVFVPGHDAQVLAVHELLAKRPRGQESEDRLIAVMTDETPLAPHVGEDVHVLHIDPVRIGIVAGRQLLWRRETPWTEPARLLVAARELSGAGQ
jgi:DNA-binding LacI/PurR family transcriptional regulator